MSQRLSLYGASLWWNPNPTASWYLKGGIGLLNYRASTDNVNDDPLTGSATALQVGGGYDIRAARKLWFSPFANLIVSSSGNLTSGNTVVTDASPLDAAARRRPDLALKRSQAAVLSCEKLHARMISRGPATCRASRFLHGVPLPDPEVQTCHRMHRGALERPATV